MKICSSDDVSTRETGRRGRSGAACCEAQPLWRLGGRRASCRSRPSPYRRVLEMTRSPSGPRPLCRSAWGRRAAAVGTPRRSSTAAARPTRRSAAPPAPPRPRPDTRRRRLRACRRSGSRRGVLLRTLTGAMAGGVLLALAASCPGSWALVPRRSCPGPGGAGSLRGRARRIAQEDDLDAAAGELLQDWDLVGISARELSGSRT